MTANEIFKMYMAYYMTIKIYCKNLITILN